MTEETDHHSEAASEALRAAARAALVETTSDAVVVADASGRIRAVNGRARALLGAGESLEGEHIEALFDPVPSALEAASGAGERADRTERGGEREQADVRERGGGNTRERVCVRAADGTPTYHELTVTRVGGGEGPERDASGLLVVLRDVSDAVARERAGERLEAVAKLLSHDVKSPLGIAETYLEFAAETGADEDFDAVSDRLERASDLVGDLLAFARLSLEDLELESRSVSETARAVWERFETEGASLAVADGLEVDADDDLLHHLLADLLRNALEHGGRPLDIEVCALEGDGFAVVDDGVGVVEGMEATAMEPGYATGDGAGLGLPTVAAIAAAHGWRVSLETPDGGGTRVEVHTDDTVNTRGGKPGHP
ncbi:ATP-binding protein [Natronobiforma cellulositropha]|uniref:ATP-binding protein n=1 Tax=Natronobiforma cellulositropha TaxID=1679076 RepID=UPI0021D5F6D5|nr:ATP-binding protein [Natronobiforma cellulositropha]